MTSEIRRPTRTIIMYSRITIWLALLFISGGMALQSIQVNLFTQSEVDNAFSHAMAAQMAHALKTQLQNTQRLQLAASQHPKTRQALETPNPTWEATLKQFIPGANKIILLRRNDAMGLQASMGYAVQQVVSRTLHGQEMKLEAVKRNNTQQFFWASAIKDNDGQIAGVLLVEYGKHWLKQFRSSTSAQLGEVVVNQYVDQNTAKGLEIFRFGRAAGNPGAIVTESINDFWYLTYVPTDKRPQLTLMPLVTSWLIVLLATLSALFVIVYFQKAALKHNQLMLLTYVRNLSRKSDNNFPTFTLQIFFDIAQQMEHLLNTARPASTKETALPREKLDIALAQPSIKQRSGNISSTPSADLPSMMVEEIEQEHIPAITPSIFRAYDIRGIVDQQLNAEVVYWIGRSLGAEIQQRGFNNINIAWDGRLSSPELAQALEKGINDSGCHSISLGAQPTGLLYFATHELNASCGVMITGSHNPAEFNGLKVVIAKQTLAQEELMMLYHRINRGDLPQGKGSSEQHQLEQAYLERIASDVHIKRELNIVIDAGNGIAGPAAKKLMDRLKVRCTPLYCDVDGHFPNHHPDTSQPHNLADLQKAVIAQQADLGLAFDGDGDRVALVDNTGKIIWPDRLLMLLAAAILPRHPDKTVLYDVKSSRHLVAFIKRYGGQPDMWKTGHSLMKKRMQETDAILGGEFSGHFYIQDRWYGFDDGLYAAARLLEIISAQPDTCAELFARLPEETSTAEITIATTDSRKFDILNALSGDAQLTSNARVLTTDGLRLEYENGWALIRPSNTTPKLTLRFAGNDQASIDQIQQKMKQALTRHAPELEVPF